MIPKFVISTLFFIMLLSLPTISPAKFFDDLSEKFEKEAKRTEKRIKKEIDRTDENLDKITQETKEKAKRTWEDHKDEIVPVVVAATVIYVGDINLATLALKEYGIINEDGTIEWGVIFSDDDKSTQPNQVGHPKKEPSSEVIVYIPQNSTSEQFKTGVMVISRKLNFPDGTTGSHTWIQIVENGKMFIVGGWKNSKTKMMDIKATEIKSESRLSEQGSVDSSDSANIDDYMGHEELSFVKINPPEGISQQEWNKKFKKTALEYHRKNDQKLKYLLSGGDNGKISGNSHTVTKHILESVQPGLSKVLESFDPKNANSGL